MNLSDLIGKSISAGAGDQYGEAIIYYDSPNGTRIGNSDDLTGSSSYTIQEYQVVNDVVGNKLWFHFEDPQQVTWVIFSPDAGYTLDGVPLVIDQSDIDAAAPSLVSGLLSNVKKGVSSVLDAVIPDSMKQQMQKLGDTVKDGIYVIVVAAALFLIWKIYKWTFGRKKK